MQTISEVRDGFKETEIGFIPEDWDIKQLREILNFSNGRRPEFTEGGVYPVFGANGIMGQSNNFLTDNDFTLIIGRVGASGQVHLASGRIWVSDNAIYSSTYDKTKIDLRFLYFLLKKIDLSRFATKTTHPLITQSFLNSFKIPLPDLPEQQKIAFVLSKIQQAIQQQDKIIKATKNLKKSLMHKLFTEGTRGEEQKETEIGLIPKSWELVKLGDVFEIQQGKSMSPKSRLGEPRYPFLRTINVLWGRIDLSSLDYMHFTNEEITKLSLQYGDLLVCEGGEVGRTAMWHGEIELCGYQNHIHRLRTTREDIWMGFYMYWMQAAFLIFGLYFGEAIRTTIPNLSQGRLSSFIIPKPPIDEQKKIADVLHSVDRKLEIEERRKAALQQLFKTTLNKLMTGEIRVKDLDLGVINVS
jgi:restriction endonuclease S subunit